MDCLHRAFGVRGRDDGDEGDVRALLAGAEDGDAGAVEHRQQAAECRRLGGGAVADGGDDRNLLAATDLGVDVVELGAIGDDVRTAAG